MKSDLISRGKQCRSRSSVIFQIMKVCILNVIPLVLPLVLRKVVLKILNQSKTVQKINVKMHETEAGNRT